MSKKRKILQASALLSAVSGATMIVAAGTTPVLADDSKLREERCWDHRTNDPTIRYGKDGCVYNQYGLPGKGGDTGDTGNGATPTDPGAGGGGGGGPEPGPYTG